MKFSDFKEAFGVGLITPQNTTADVKPGETQRQASKWGFKVDKKGKPPTLKKKTRGSVTNVLYNLGQVKENVSDCPRTRAHLCQCESLSRITEGSETAVIAQSTLEHSDTVEGLVLLIQDPSGGPTLIKGTIRGLEPGEHGFHIHEYGDLSQGCESAGGHYNPDGVDHGDLENGHVGDLGNITANEDGVAEFTIKAERVDLVGERSVVGRAIVVHADVDDLGKGGDAESRKTGNAGDRLACGVIVLRNEKVEETYTRSQLPQIKNKNLDNIQHTLEWAKLQDLVPVQEERIIENFKRQVDRIVAGKYNPIIVDCDNKIVNGHHRYEAARLLGYDEVAVAKLPWTVATIVENFADGKKFVEPNFNSEWGEAERYPEFKKLGKEEWIKLASKGKATTIKSAKDINNTDANDPNSFKTLDPAKQKRALAQIKSGKVELPIVAVYSDGYKELIGGNTRLTAMMAQDGQATVWAFKVPDEVAELAETYADRMKKKTQDQLAAHDKAMIKSARKSIKKYEKDKEDKEQKDENFADGKKKGKSRPGRVKKAGASCKGSVTSLRKKAAKYSGEKGKMYHWCANMKGGRKK